jgi:hypothetical protein
MEGSAANLVSGVVSGLFNNDINRIRSGFIVGVIAALSFALPSGLFAQSSPLTVQPSTGRVSVGTTTPTETLDVTGTVKATAFTILVRVPPGVAARR